VHLHYDLVYHGKDLGFRVNDFRTRGLGLVLRAFTF
jgi:hypothetical protein